ncbi:MAG: MalY/PatB family protein [Lachnospiraceae bacterium]
MEFDFETLVERRPANLKRMLMPGEIVDAGNISFNGAEPDFKTAPVIEAAVTQFARKGLYGFTICDETYENAVVWWMKHSRKTEIRPEWIVPTLGTIYSVATAIRLCTRESEGIIVTTPVYNRYKQAADRLNRKTVDCPLIQEETTYHMDFAAIEEAMQESTNRLLIICNPHNPIGQIWRTEELEQLAELANRYDVTVFADEIFGDNCYQGLQCPCYLDVKGAAKHAIVATSLGKAFGFTGVNHANILIADDDLREQFIDRRTRDHYGSIDPMIYECVLAAYRQEGMAWVEASNRYVEENIRRIRLFFEKNFPNVKIYGGQGGYILWMDWRAYFSSEKELMDFLIQKAHFCVGEGSDYNRPGFTRMCVASPWYCIEKALEDLKAAFHFL